MAPSARYRPRPSPRLGARGIVERLLEPFSKVGELVALQAPFPTLQDVVAAGRKRERGSEASQDCGLKRSLRPIGPWRPSMRNPDLHLHGHLAPQRAVALCVLPCPSGASMLLHADLQALPRLAAPCAVLWMDRSAATEDPPPLRAPPAPATSPPSSYWDPVRKALAAVDQL